MKYFLPIIILSFVLLSCAKEDEKEETLSDSALQATWKTACYTDDDNKSLIVTPTFSGSTVTVIDEKHSDTSCATDSRLLLETHKYEVKEAGKKFELTIGSTKQRTAQSNSTVTTYNSESKCGHSDWQLNVAKACSDEGAGEVVYCLYEVSGSTLYVDCDGSAYPTSLTKTSSSTFTKQ